MNADREMSSREYEREAEASRHRLAGSLRELNHRLTPGNIIDEVLAYAKGGGGSFLNALSNAAKDNPVPSLLIGAGLLMFLSEKAGLSHMLTGQHDATQLPVVLLGRGGGKIQAGRVLDYRDKPNRHMCRLYLSMMDKMNVRLEKFGDASEPLVEV